jgi:hypothetical protein
MADDKYGHKTLYFTISGEKERDVELISYYYVENDSYQYINRGAQRRIVVEFSSYVTVDLLKFVIEKMNPSKGIKHILQRMINENKIQSGEYSDIED